MLLFAMWNRMEGNKCLVRFDQKCSRYKVESMHMFFFLWMSKSPTTNSLLSGSPKVITSFSFQTSNWSPLFFRDFNKNPFESFRVFEASKELCYLWKFQRDFFTVSPDCCTPFWNFDPLTLFPLGKTGAGSQVGHSLEMQVATVLMKHPPRDSMGWTNAPGVWNNKLHRAGLLGFPKQKENEEFGPKKSSWRRYISILFFPFLVEKISRRKKANIREFQRLPSRKLTYPPKMAFWRWFSFSPGGIC